MGTNSRLAEAIRRASDNEIETSDVSAQLEFVANDLSNEPYFVRLKNRDGPDPKFAVFGQFLSYELSPYRQPGSAEVADWEFAFCEKADVGRPPPGAIVKTEPIDPGSLELATTIDAVKSFPRKRGRVERWEAFLLATEPKEVRKTDLDRMHQAFSLLLVLEMAYAAADVFPVEVLPGSADKIGDLHRLRVASRYDPSRAALSTALGLEAPAVRLTKVLIRGMITAPRAPGRSQKRDHWVTARMKRSGVSTMRRNTERAKFCALRDQSQRRFAARAL